MNLGFIFFYIVSHSSGPTWKKNDKPWLCRAQPTKSSWKRLRTKSWKPCLLPRAISLRMKLQSKYWTRRRWGLLRCIVTAVFAFLWEVERNAKITGFSPFLFRLSPTKFPKSRRWETNYCIFNLVVSSWYCQSLHDVVVFPSLAYPSFVIGCRRDRAENQRVPSRLHTNCFSCIGAVLLHNGIAKYWPHVPVFPHLVCQPVPQLHPRQVIFIILLLQIYYYCCGLGFASWVHNLLAMWWRKSL